MATNDGYSPYPVPLTALQVKDALVRASNLTVELANYVGHNTSATLPTLATGIKAGDIWEDTANGIYYRAYVDTVIPASPVLVFFEV